MFEYCDHTVLNELEAHPRGYVREVHPPSSPSYTSLKPHSLPVLLLIEAIRFMQAHANSAKSVDGTASWTVDELTHILIPIC